MATIVTRVHAYARPAGDARKMILTTERSTWTLVVPYAPRVVNYTGFEQDWQEVPRPGRYPILGSAGQKLKKMSFDLFLGNKNRDVDVETIISRLVGLAGSSDRILVSFSSREAGLWRISGLSIASAHRNRLNQRIVQATATVEFTQAVDAPVKVGPASGGHSTPRTVKRATTYTIRLGDTLHSISIKFYGDARYWRALAKANKLKSLYEWTLLAKGGRLRIPTSAQILRLM